MKAAHLMTDWERREHLETSLTNAEFMLKMETDISQGQRWSERRRLAAIQSIPAWLNRITELKSILKKY